MARSGGAQQSRRVAAAEEAIRAAGYELRYVEYVESASTRTNLGFYPSGTDREAGVVKVRRALRGWKLVDALEHEARHLAEPDWDCGEQDRRHPPAM